MSAVLQNLAHRATRGEGGQEVFYGKEFLERELAPTRRIEQPPA